MAMQAAGMPELLQWCLQHLDLLTPFAQLQQQFLIAMLGILSPDCGVPLAPQCIQEVSPASSCCLCNQHALVPAHVMQLITNRSLCTAQTHVMRRVNAGSGTVHHGFGPVMYSIYAQIGSCNA